MDENSGLQTARSWMLTPLGALYAPFAVGFCEPNQIRTAYQWPQRSLEYLTMRAWKHSHFWIVSTSISRLKWPSLR